MRRLCVLVVIACGVSNTLFAADLLILREGSRITGKLRACVANECRIESQTVGLATISWIGIEQSARAMPPRPRDTASDEVHLRTGDVEPGELVGVSLRKVISEGAQWDREKVSWIYLASSGIAPAPAAPRAADEREEQQINEEPEPPDPPEAETEQRSGGGVPAPETNPPSSSAPRTRTRQPPPPPRSPANAVKPCPAAKPLGVHLEVRQRYSERLTHSRSTRTGMWVTLAPEHPVGWPDVLSQFWIGKNVIYRSEGSECADTPGDPEDHNCTCPPKIASGRSPGSSIQFLATDPTLNVTLDKDLREAVDTEGTCIGRTSFGTNGSNTTLPDTTGFSPPGTAPEMFLSRGTRCAGPDPDPDCVRLPQLYAQIPLAGYGTDEYRHGMDDLTVRTVRWEICCGCGEPPRGILDGENDPCGGTANEFGLLQVAVSRSEQLRGQLIPRFARFKSAWQQAESYKSDFNLVVESCAGWEISQLLIAALLGGAGAPQFAQTLGNVLSWLDKVANEDPSLALDLLAAFGLQGAAEAGEIWGAVDTIVNGALNAANAGSIDAMEAKLNDCAGVPLVSDLVYNDAGLYLRNLRAAFSEVPEMRRLMTLIQQSDVDVLNKRAAYRRACVEDARCRGVDPSFCGVP